VFRHGAVYTVDAKRSWAEAVAVSGDRIVYVGFDHAVRPWTGDGTVVVDLGGRMLLPGFHDSHAHPLEAGVALGECALHDATSVQEILELIAEFAREQPEAQWIRGGGWQLPVFPEANPNKALLDQIVPDRPVYLTSADA
jgi:predicted amidohydrolase YtcJ